MNKERLLNTFLDLVKIPSPSGNERRVADYIINFANANGIEVYEDHSQDASKGNTSNILAILKAEGKKRIMFSAHMDTVCPCESIHPIIEEGVIRSDGTSILGGDDKAGIATMLELMLEMKEEKDRPEILFAFSYGEEIGLNGARGLDLEALGKVEACYVLDSSGQVGEIIDAAPFSANGTLKVIGKEAHAGIAPELGVNALVVASAAISQLHIGRLDEETTCNIGKVTGGLASNIVMPSVEMVFEARSLELEKLELLLANVHETFKETCSELNAVFETTVKLKTPGFKINHESEIAQKAVAACEQLGIEPFFKTSGGGSDANIFNSKGLPSLTLAVGMSDVHTVHEFIKIEDLEKTVDLITEITKQYK